MHNPLIFALDYDNGTEAYIGVERLGNHIGMIKLGLEFFSMTGCRGLIGFWNGRDIRGLGLPLMLDLKLHDIPETVERTIRVIGNSHLNAKILTVHSFGGKEMLERAAIQADKYTMGPRICAVSLLSSLGGGDLSSMGIGDRTIDFSLRLARMAFQAGIRHFVCSPQEVLAYRQEFGRVVTLIVPGIRLEGDEVGDQKRTGTPEQAMKHGADYLVLGRSLRNAKNPEEIAKGILERINPFIKKDANLDSE